MSLTIIDVINPEPSPLPKALLVLDWQILMHLLEDSKQLELKPNEVIDCTNHKLKIVSLPQGSLPCGT